MRSQEFVKATGLWNYDADADQQHDLMTALSMHLDRINPDPTFLPKTPAK